MYIVRAPSAIYVQYIFSVTVQYVQYFISVTVSLILNESSMSSAASVSTFGHTVEVPPSHWLRECESTLLSMTITKQNAFCVYSNQHSF